MKPEERFWRKVEKGPGCWLWKASLRNRYGQFGVKPGYIEFAHRFSYELKYGAVPKGLFVCHSCDNKICVNPKHLFLGTALDNNRDCWNKGRGLSPFRKQTHCKNGHQFRGFEIKKNGHRVNRCLDCMNLNNHKTRRAKGIPERPSRRVTQVEET